MILEYIQKAQMRQLECTMQLQSRRIFILVLKLRFVALPFEVYRLIHQKVADKIDSYETKAKGSDKEPQLPSIKKNVKQKKITHKTRSAI